MKEYFFLRLSLKIAFLYKKLEATTKKDGNWRSGEQIAKTVLWHIAKPSLIESKN